MMLYTDKGTVAAIILSPSDWNRKVPLSVCGSTFQQQQWHSTTYHKALCKQ